MMALSVCFSCMRTVRLVFWPENYASLLRKLALEHCLSRRFITSKEALEHADETTSATPLSMHAYFGESTDVECC